MATSYRKTEVVAMLLCDFDCLRGVRKFLNCYRTLLHTVCSWGDVFLVKTLIHECKMNVNVPDDQNNTPLHVAASCGEEDVVLMLISECKCDLTVRGHLNRTLLHSACSGGNAT